MAPSQRISQKDYIVWIIVAEDKDEMPGGKIITAYCQCTAGLMGLRNHIGGILFRIEATILQGLTCTSILTKYNISSLKAVNLK